MLSDGSSGPRRTCLGHRCLWILHRRDNGCAGAHAFSPLLATVALRFGPVEISAILLLSFTMITHLASGSKLKAVAMAIVGLILGTVGQDPEVVTPRFAYGSITLMDGIGLAPLAMGLFGISEIFSQPGENE